MKNLLLIGKGRTVTYPLNESFRFFFAETVKHYSNSHAIFYKEETLTFEETQKLVHQFSNLLIAKGIKIGARIGVFCTPSVEMVIAVLALLNLGMCYVPLDTAYPKERLKYIIEDSNIEVILTNGQQPPLLKETDICIDIKNLTKLCENFSSLNHPPIINSEQAAYLIYSSGSTGKPKGIIVPHRALSNHMCWIKEQFNFCSKDTILFKTPITFDPSIWEILLPFYCGARLIIAPQHAYKEPSILIKIINEYKVTILQTVPIFLLQLLQKMSSNDCKSLVRIFVGGESLPRKTKEVFFKKISCQLINLYGPAETTIDITFHKVQPSLHHFSHDIIGKPIANNHLLVINEKGALCEVNKEGELCISGHSLSLGYCNQSDLNKKKFVPNPYLEGQIMYKTGDIVKWLSDGSLEYIGRRDTQLKINGVRIDADALVNQIMHHPHVSDCVITKATNDRDHAYIVCYLVATNNEIINIEEIRRFLADHFPYYMLPKKYFLLKKIPVTPNGKLDTKALDKEAILAHSNEQTSQNNSLIEQQVQDIWKIVLNLEKVHPRENFFDLGGDSLLTLILLNTLKEELYINLNIEDIILAPTIIEQARLIQKRLNSNSEAANNFLVPLNSSNKKTNLFLIHPIGGTLFWFTHLAKGLEDTCQVYGIQDPEITDDKISFTSILEIANLYTEKIQEVQKKGPYVLGGASFGATVAIEIANLLTQQSATVKVIFNFDGWALYPKDLKDQEFFKALMTRQQLDWLSKFNDYNQAFDRDTLFKIQWKRVQLLYNYVMNPFDHNMILFKAAELLAYFKTIADPNNHWLKYSNTFKKIESAGDHETMFMKPQVESLIENLKKHLD